MVLAQQVPGLRWPVLLAAATSALAVVTGIAVIGRTRLQARSARTAARTALQEVAQGKVQAAGILASETSGDDLKMIEGIGPRAEGVLRARGIDSFERLAALRPGRIETILREAGGKMANPRSWPGQARLAAEGRWDELRQLQARLSRGAARST
jgi:large subunit ribosomal protein L21